MRLGRLGSPGRVLPVALAMLLAAGVGASALGGQGLAKAVTGATGRTAHVAALNPGALPPASLAAAPLPSAPAAPAASPSPVVVQPLATLRAADLLVTVRKPLTPAQVQALQQVRKVTAISVVDVGTVQVGGRGVRIVGVDPSTFRSFTPQETASSDALWQVVARGEVAPDYLLARSRALALGSDVVVGGATQVPSRIGAVASFGLPGIEMVTDRATTRRLGVVPSSAVLVSAPDRGIAALRRAVREVVGRDAIVDVLRPEVTAAPEGRPRTYRELYIDSARYCPGLSWTVLAAIGQVESGHGRNNGPSSAGALGPMQFLPSTWAAYGLDGDRDGDADINDPFDAIPSAAAYLCRFGANKGPDQLYSAVYAYNHLDSYVQQVLALSAQYR